MRFKQALSRKLAAALSAVMILSTIAPTSVPVLAAVPDDVLVDSSAEYNLSDAGSEDLLTPAESSLAEESDALEVAEEELLTSEPASEETIVDAADAAAETGAEPAEAPEGGDPEVWSIPVKFAGGSVLSSISVNYFDMDGDNKVISGDYVIYNDDADIVSADHAGIAITGMTVGTRSFTGEPYEAGDYEITVSRNDFTTQTINDVNSVVSKVAGEVYDGALFFSFAEDSKDVPVYIDAEQIKFSVNLTIDNSESQNIVKEISYKVGGSGTDTPYEGKTVSVDNITATDKLQIAITGKDSEVDESVYELSVNNTAKSVGDYEDIEVTEDCDITVPVKAVINDGFNTGALTIKTTSANIIKQVNYQYVDTNYTYKDGEFAKSYVDSASENVINNDADITDDYMYAKTVNVWVADDDEEKNPDGKYVYTIKYKDAEGQDETKEVAKGTGSDENTITVPVASTATTIEIGVKQVKFDATVNVTIASNNKIAAFKYQFDGGTAEPYNISQNEVSFTAENAEKITFSDFVSPAGVDNDSYELIVKANGKEVEGTPYEIDITGDSVDVSITAEPKAKVLISGNKVNENWIVISDTIIKFEDGSETAISLLGHDTFSTTDSAYFYVRTGSAIGIGEIRPNSSKPWNFPYLINETDKNKEIKADKTEEYYIWKTDKITSDTVLKLEAREYKVKDVLNIVKDQGDAITVSYDEITSGVGHDTTLSSDSIENMVVLNDSNEAFVVGLHTDRSKDDYDNEIAAAHTLDWSSLDESGAEIECKVTNPGDDNVYTVSVPGSAVDFNLRSSEKGKEKITVNVQQRHNLKKYPVYLKESNSNSVKAKVVFEDETVAKLEDGSEDSVNIPYGKKININAEEVTGWKLVSVSINKADKYGQPLSTNIVTIKSTDKAFADFDFDKKGYVYESKNKNVAVIFNTEADYSAEVEYASGDSEVAKDAKGVYNVYWNRPINITYKLGATAQTDFGFQILKGKNTVSSDKIKIQGGKLVFDVKDNKDLQNTTVTIKLFAKGTKVDDKDNKSVVTLTFKVDTDNKSITFKDTEVKMTAGTVKTITASKVAGNILGTEASVSGAVIPGLEFETSDGNKKLTIKTTVETAKAITAAAKKATGDSRTVDVLIKDKYDGTVYATIKLTLDTTSIAALAAPEIKITGTSNHTATISLKPDKKLDKSVEGLFYKIETAVTPNTNPDLQGRTIYIPVTDVTCKLEFLSDEVLADKTSARYMAAIQADYSKDYKFEIKNVSVVQMSGGDEIVTGKSLESAIEAKVMEGGIFATKITLSKAKGNPSKVYTNMTKKNSPFTINVAYNKGTSVQQLANVYVYGPNGQIAENVNFEYDDSVIRFWTAKDTYPGNYKGGDCLPAGTYTVYAFALEPNGKDVSASMKIKVVDAIEALSLGEAAEKEMTIYKPIGKNSTATLTAYDTTLKPVWDTDEYVSLNKATKKVNWQIVKGTTGDDANTEPDYVKSKDITIKNGKITIKKSFTLDSTSFYVKAVAKDYKENTSVVAFSEKITVKSIDPNDQKRALKVAFSKDGKFNTVTPIKDGVVDDLFDKNGADGYEYITYVAAYEQETTADPAKWVPATFKVNGAKLIDTQVVEVEEQRFTAAKIGFTKLGKMKFTVTATDGSNRALKGKTAKEVNVNALSGAKVGFNLFSSEGGEPLLTNIDWPNNKAIESKTLSANNYQAANANLYLSVYGLNGKRSSYVTNKVSVKGGKIAKTLKNGVSSYTITPTAHETIITMDNVDTKSKGVNVIKVTNVAIPDTKSFKTATKISAVTNGNPKAKGAIYNDIYFRGNGNYDQLSVNNVTYTITQGASEADYALVKVVMDKKGTAYNIGQMLDKVTGKVSMGDNTYAIPLNAQKAFTVRYADDNGDFYIKAGTYKLEITPVKKIADKQFKAVGKTVNQSVSAKAAPKASVKPSARVVFSSKLVSGNKVSANIIDGKYNNIIGTDGTKTVVVDKNSGTAVYAKSVTFAGLLDVNNKGKMNKFHDNFILKGENNRTLEYQGKESLFDKAAKINEKDKLSGWVTFTYQALDGRTKTDYVKVTITSTAK